MATVVKWSVALGFVGYIGYMVVHVLEGFSAVL